METDEAVAGSASGKGKIDKGKKIVKKPGSTTESPQVRAVLLHWPFRLRGKTGDAIDMSVARTCPNNVFEAFSDI